MLTTPVAPVDMTSCRIDERGPFPVHQPRSVAEVGDLVRRAAAEGLAVFPLGGRTALDLGLPPDRAGLGADLRGLNQVLDYPARDMTVTVQAGITLARLQALLAAEGQRLPVDVPQPERATLGGALAVNASGPRRLGFGTLRDYVIGISTVNDEGQETRAGGRVVKNVAGYDLCKLHVGALGTLGIITQVTLKLRPLPEATALLAFGCDAAALPGLLDQLHATRTRPCCLDVLNRAAASALARATRLGLPDAPWVVALGFEDNGEAVSWQVGQLLREISPRQVRGVEARAGEAAAPLWQALAEFTAWPARLTLKANLLPSAVASFAARAEPLAEGLLLHAHAGSGVVRGHLGGDLTLARVGAMLEELHELAAQTRGNLVLPRCPPDWKRTLPVWGRPRPDAGLMRRVKEKLDPQRLFNPGRFVDGI